MYVLEICFITLYSHKKTEEKSGYKKFILQCTKHVYYF